MFVVSKYKKLSAQRGKHDESRKRQRGQRHTQIEHYRNGRGPDAFFCLALDGRFPHEFHRIETRGWACYLFRSPVRDSSWPTKPLTAELAL